VRVFCIQRVFLAFFNFGLELTFYGLYIPGVFMYIIVRYRMKLCSTFHKKAETCPQDRAIKLILLARCCPTSLVRRSTLPSKAFNSLVMRELSTSVKRRLRTRLTTLTVSSICARSALFNILNHTPFRIAMVLTLANLPLVIGIQNRVRPTIAYASSRGSHHA